MLFLQAWIEGRSHPSGHRGVEKVNVHKQPTLDKHKLDEHEQWWSKEHQTYI